HLRLLEGYSGIRTLVFTGDPSTARPYQGAREQVPGQVEELRRSVADNPPQQARMQVLFDRTRSLLNWLADQEHLVRSGRREVALARVDAGMLLLGEVRTSVDAILREEQRLDRDRIGALRKSSARQLWMLVGGGTVIVVSTLLIAVLFLLGITRRLAVLRDNA